mgnify:CR=1 FL=1
MDKLAMTKEPEITGAKGSMVLVFISFGSANGKFVRFVFLSLWLVMGENVRLPHFLSMLECFQLCQVTSQGETKTTNPRHPFRLVKRHKEHPHLLPFI